MHGQTQINKDKSHVFTYNHVCNKNVALLYSHMHIEIQETK